MDPQEIFRSINLARGYMKTKVDDLKPDQLLKVPAGAANNVLWNVGHIILSNYSMVYGPSGAKPPVPDTWAGWFKPGTSPAGWGASPPKAEDVLSQFNSQTARL